MDFVMADSNRNWNVGMDGILECWVSDSENPTPLHHHSITPFSSISSLAPIVPGLCRAGGGVEQGALGHGADHGAAIVRRRAHVADRLGFLGGDLAGLLS